MKKPNVLFLMMDEHRFDVSGFMGNGIVKTPNLDALAKDAVVFDNAYAQNPVCIPCRQCMLAGELSSTCKCTKWMEDLPPNYLTFPRVMSQYGYETVAAGKLHLVGQDQMQGFTIRIGSETRVHPDYIENVKVKHPTPISFKWPQHKEVARAGIGTSYWQKQDKHALDGLLMFIEEFFASPFYDRATPENPVMLKLSLNMPHYPYFTDAEKFTYYLNRVKLYQNTKKAEHPFLSMMPVDENDERELKRMMAAYYGMIETADDYFGQIVSALEAVGQNIDDWIVVYTTDHGEMLGEHGVMEKQKFYEGSVRIPFFIRYPQKYQGKRVSQNVSNIDVFSTLLEMCDIPCEKKVDSRSLVPLMNGDTSNWQNEVIAQFGGENIMFKRDNVKYQYYLASDTQVLFDLEKDPQENINYINDEEYMEFINYCKAEKIKMGF